MQCTTWSCNGATSNSLLVHIVMCSALAANCLDRLARFFPNSVSSGTGVRGRKPSSRSFLPPFQTWTGKGQLAGGKTKKGRINMKLQNLIHILMGIVCIGLLPKAQAISPPPDGGYPGFNTAEGGNALKNLNSADGVGNTAVGWFSLFSDVEGGFNTAIGVGALVLNTGVQTRALAL